MGEFKFVLARFDVRAAESLHIVLIEDGLHGFDLAQRLFELAEQFLFEHAGVQCSVVCGVGENIPGAEDEIFELGQWHEVFDQRHAILGSFPETNRSHLRETTDGLRITFLDGLNTGDERGADGA